MEFMIVQNILHPSRCNRFSTDLNDRRSWKSKMKTTSRLMVSKNGLFTRTINNFVLFLSRNHLFFCLVFFLHTVFTYNSGECDGQKCSKFGECRNYRSGRCCQCKPGYYGSGVQCVPDGNASIMDCICYWFHFCYRHFLMVGYDL